MGCKRFGPGKIQPWLTGFRAGVRCADLAPCGLTGGRGLACQTKVKDLGAGPVSLGPLPGLPVIKDLVVDMSTLWDAYRRVMPWLVEKPEGKDMVITKKTSDVMEKFYSCILCAACVASCPEGGAQHKYLGPMPLMEGFRLYCDPRDNAKEERKRVLGGTDGVWGCHGAFACLEACPWDVAPVQFISKLRRELMSEKFKLRKGV